MTEVINNDAAPEREGFAEVAGGYLYYRVRGQGPDVVLVNPGGTDLRVWESTAARLAGTARVTTFDLRETGLSSAGTAPYSEIDDIAAVLDAAEVPSAVLVGVSDGGRRVLAFAHHHPDRVRRAVVSGATLGEFPDPSPQEEAARQVMREHFTRRTELLTREGVRAAAEADLAGWAPELSRNDRRKLLGQYVANASLFTLEEYLGTELDPPVKHRLAEITVPISVVVGRHDFAGTCLWAERIATQAPNATLTVLPDADHFPMFTAPDAFDRILRAALA